MGKFCILNAKKFFIKIKFKTINLGNGYGIGGFYA
jgi:hypothetical protein